MILFKEADALQEFIKANRQKGQKIGFVPTMGALHAGHISLIRSSSAIDDITVCSIFVNPTQFNDPKDFKKYPVTLSNDILLLEQTRCDILFLPSVEEIYPGGTASLQYYELGNLENILEGKYRPGHFQGVCQVMHRLLNIVTPNHLFLGQKDYQQCMIIQRLVSILQLPIEVITSPTFREPSGLAMSSRNLRLSHDDKQNAQVIYKALVYIKEHYNQSNTAELEMYATEYLLQHGFKKVDYVSIADATTLLPVTSKSPQQKVVALIAAFIGEVRLIDNMMIAE